MKSSLYLYRTKIVKPHSIHISIPKPCQEQWDGMTATERGAFCQSCQTEVIDFSTMTDREVVEYLSKNKTGCGRFRNDQLNTNISIPAVENGVFKWRALLLGFLSLISVKPLFASNKILIAKSDTSTKIISDTMKLKELSVFPDRKVGEISVAKSNTPIYQIPTKESDSISAPLFIPEVEIESVQYLTAGGISVHRTPTQKLRYFFRYIFRIRHK